MKSSIRCTNVCRSQISSRYCKKFWNRLFIVITWRVVIIEKICTICIILSTVLWFLLLKIVNNYLQILISFSKSKMVLMKLSRWWNTGFCSFSNSIFWSLWWMYNQIVWLKKMTVLVLGLLNVLDVFFTKEKCYWCFNKIGFLVMMRLFIVLLPLVFLPMWDLSRALVIIADWSVGMLYNE